MKKISFLFILCIAFLSCKNQTESSEITAYTDDETLSSNYGIVIHGGAGAILKENMSPALEDAYKQALKDAISVGHNILKNGGTSLNAVEQTIMMLEDNPLFNAGKGAVFTYENKNELDASIMDGKEVNAGAVAGVTTVKNPIRLARAIMEKSQHVMLAGKGAESFAKQHEIPLVAPSYFYTEDKIQALKRVKENEKAETDHKFGTVGCVALDKSGNLAAGTSTGGMTNKRWGRIGDVPVIGAGTYANNRTSAISSTGWGEFFIRAVVAHDISALMEYKRLSLQEAAKEVIQNKVSSMGGRGGIIAIDRKGNIAMEFNTPGMYRAAMNNEGELTLKIYKD